MTDFIFNLTNPPEEYEPGQIWKSASTNYDFLLTDTKFSHLGIVKGLVISRIVEAGDNDDVVFNDLEFYPGNRIAFRLTRIPLPKEDLILYVGKIEDDLLNKVQTSLKNNSTLGYNEMQLATIGEFIDEITQLRNKAVVLMEKSIGVENETANEVTGLSKETKIFEITSLINYELEFYKYQKAADTLDEKYKLHEFWDKEREGKAKALNIISNDDLSLRLSVLDGHLYVVVYSNKYKSISNIFLKSNNKVIKAINEQIDISKEKRGFSCFEKTMIDPGKYELQISLDNKKMLFPVDIK